jgi:hypothetical protein
MNESQYHRFGNPSRVRIMWDWYDANYMRSTHLQMSNG